jgi:hypothetical protein
MPNPDAIQNARDAWALQSWLIWPHNEREGPTRSNLARLADALESWPGGLAGPALAWPSALRECATA